MLEVSQTTRINSDADEDDLKPGEYRDALNISLIANAAGAFTKGTTFGNIDTNIVFKGLQLDAICLGSAVDVAGDRAIVAFYQVVGITPEVLMYLLVPPLGGEIVPLIKSQNMFVNERSYLDGYSFVNELFFFNFRESAPKMINIERAQSSPGFYDSLDETALTVLKPHPPYAPVPVRDNTGGVVNAPIQKKAFQFMMLYRFLDGEQSTKSPTSEYLNSLDDIDTLTSTYDHINVTMTFPVKDYATLESMELFVRNTNDLADWRSVNIFPRTLFVLGGANYSYVYPFYDNVVGNFYPLELSAKQNDSIPQRSNYMAFIENRLFMIDSLIDYDIPLSFQIIVTLDVNATTPDDRTPTPSPLYGLAEFEWDSEYTLGLAFYDKYGRKYPATATDKKLVTPVFVPVTLPAADALPKQGAVLSPTEFPQLRKAKNTAKYDLRAAGNPANYGKPPAFAYWWSLIRSKNIKWEFQQSIQCLLRFPFSIVPWPDTDPASFPDPNMFLEDGYLYWDPYKLMSFGAGAGSNVTQTMVNEYIDVVIPSNFPHPLDNTILIDFMMEIISDIAGVKVTILNSEVVSVFANKVRIRGNRRARWFSNNSGGGVVGQFRSYPKFTTGVNLNVGQFLYANETTFPLVIKRRRQNNLSNIILYDIPQVYPVVNPGTPSATFQNQVVNIVRTEFPPLFIAPVGAAVLVQGDILVQPANLTPTSIATNHAIKITWGPNVGDALRLQIKVSIWQLNDQKQPTIELYSATENAGVPYRVGNGTTVEYLINKNAELINGWYGYGIQILPFDYVLIQFENPYFDILLEGWRQSPEGLSNLLWKWASVEANFAYVIVSTMLGGYSKTLYQRLDQATKEDVLVEVVVEAIGISGPIINAPIVQYPGNAGLPLANNSTEELIDLSRNIVPYFIDCDTPPRTVKLNTLNYSNIGIPPIGAMVRAEIWNIDQTTKEPISMIPGSEGAWTLIPPGAPPHAIPFGVNKTINLTGWYGISLAYDGPEVADFTDKNYASGASFWIVTNEAFPSWVFSPDQTLPPVYADITFSPAVGADLGYRTMDTPFLFGGLIFIPVGADPAGYDQHRIIVDWGDNVTNKWQGFTIDVSIWEVDQITKKPTSIHAIYIGTTDVRSGGPSTHFISNTSKIVPNKWYAYGLTSPRALDNSHTEFVNSYFPSGLAGWTTTAGVNGAWSGGPNGIGSTSNVAGAFDTGVIYQVMPADTVMQVSLPVIFLAVGGYTAINIEVVLQGVVKQTISIPTALGRYSASFNAFRVLAGQGVGIRIYGTVSGLSAMGIGAIVNAWNPYQFSTPIIRKYAVANPSYESWLNYNNHAVVDGSSVVDGQWEQGLNYWKKTSHGQTLGVEVNLSQGPFAGFPASTFLDKIYIQHAGALAASISDTIYGMINMNDVVGVKSFTLNMYVKRKIFAGASSNIQLWVFNDPNTFTATGVNVASYLLIAGTGDLNFLGMNVLIPGGYKYLGIRFTDSGGGADISQSRIDRFDLQADEGFNVWSSWYKDGTTAGFQALERELVSPGGFTLANFHVDNVPVGVTTGRIGQDFLSGLIVQANIELFVGPLANDYDLILTDTSGFELGRTSVIGQAKGVNPVITVTAVNPPTTTGLYLSIQNKNVAGIISARIRQITNVPTPVQVQADNTIANAKTWQRDAFNNNVQLATTTLTSIDGTDDIPQPALDLTVVLADELGNITSVAQTFPANAGPQTLVFSPTLQAGGNFNYGVKVINNAFNIQTDGIVKVHSIKNIISNVSVANIITHTIDPGQPSYQAWKQSLGPFVLAGYVSNFIAVIDDIQIGAFTPIAISPSDYHVVANVVQAGVQGHSTTYVPPGIQYDYGIVFPSASSDPDAPGAVYLSKVGESIGDVNVKIVDLGQKSNSNIVRWSDPIIIGTRTNNTNAFSEVNKYPVDFQRGAIQVMFAMHDHTLFCVHKQGMSSLYVQRATMTSAGEGPQELEPLFLTSKVIGNDNKLTTNMGTVNPESCRVVESGTIAYGFDLIRKSFWQKTNNGVRNLTYECNGKKLFNRICNYRLKAYNEGEDVKIYSGYNEKLKVFYLTFAPFIYRGQEYPAETVAYSAYIDGFLSRYSFTPLSYLAIEDVLHSINPKDSLSAPGVWAHNQEGLTNNFYGVQYDSMINLIFNVKDGQVRIFNNLSIMSPVVWSVESITTSEGQISALSEENFRLRDGVYYAALMRDMLTPQNALPNPATNTPLVHGTKLMGVWINIVLRNDETLRQIELRAVYLGSDQLAGNFLNKF